jgi:hypothetical protein
MFVLLHFRRKFGDRKTVKKKYKSFLIGIVSRLDGGRRAAAGEDVTALAWITLFAQLCGIDSPSGRLAALPPGACDYCLDRIHDLEPDVHACLKEIPATAVSPLQRKMVSGRNAFLLGCAFEERVEPAFKRALRKHLTLRATDDAYHTALGTLRSLAECVEVAGAARKTVNVPALMSLYAVVFAAVGAAPGAPARTPGAHGGGGATAPTGPVRPMY